MRKYMQSETDFGIAFRLSVQRALVGEVGPNVRHIAVDWDWSGRRAWIRYFFADVPSDEDRDSAEMVLAEVIADFPEVPDELLIENDLTVARASDPPQRSGTWAVYGRRERS